MAAPPLATGLSEHPLSGAQLGDVGILINGHDPNMALDLRTGTLNSLGVASPGAAPTGADQGAGNVNGAVKYRVRWKDSSTGSISLPSAALSRTPVNQIERITSPGSPPSRATHWVLERTTDGGRIYYLVNVDSSNPDGTPVATTTFDDNLSDSTIRNKESLESNQGLPPVRYRFCWANGRHLFMAGSRRHRPTVSVTNASAAVSSSDGDFTQDMVGEDFSVDGDSDGKTYRILSIADANNLTLATNYAGSTQADVAATISGPGNIEAWSDTGQPEHWGRALLSGELSQSNKIGGADELTAGIGLGQAGCLLAKEDRLYLHSYTLHPSPSFLGGDGRIVPLLSRRGAFGPKSLYNVDGVIYGQDVFGVWRLVPGSEPVEIGSPLKDDWKSLNLAQRGNAHIGYDPAHRMLYFFVPRTGETYPKRAYTWDLDRGAWVGWSEWDLEVPCTVVLPDQNGVPRMMIYHAALGNVKSYAWFVNIGENMGAAPGTPNLTGTVTGGTATTLTDSGAAWPTSGEALAGIPVLLTRASDGSQETQFVESNTATVLTTTAWTGVAPASGDSYEIGPIKSEYRTGRITIDPTRKKYFKRVHLWVKHDSSAVKLNMRAYFNGSVTPFSDRAALSEDGMTIVSGAAPVTFDPTAQTGQSVNIHRFQAPLGKWAQDVQLEFYSTTPGGAWQIVAVQIEYKMDPADTPRKD